jgi:WD40 repeat protein
MDRFLSQWKRQAARASGGPAAAAEEEEEEDDLADFVVDDIDDEEEENEDEEEVEDDDDADGARQLQRSSSVQLPKRIKLQPKRSNKDSSNSSSSKNKSAVASTGGSKPRAVLDLTLAPSTKKHVTKRLTSKAEALFQLQYQGQLQPRPPAAAVTTQLPGNAAASANVTAASSQRAIAAPVAASSAAVARPSIAGSAVSAAAPPFMQRSSSAPSSGNAVSSSVASGSSNTARKRKRLSLADEDNAADAAEAAEQQRLIDLIDMDDDEQDVAALTRYKPDDHAPPPKPPESPSPLHNRNLLGLLYAASTGALPFASQQRARLARLQRELAAKAKLSPQPNEETDGSALDATVSLQSVGIQRSSNSAAASAGSSTSAKPHPLPAFVSSTFRRAHVLHGELMHHAQRELLWSQMRCVSDWSLSGPLDEHGRAAHERPPNVGPSEVSYINGIEFDSSGSLMSTSSNNALVNLYDFDLLWMQGRRVEAAKRERALHEHIDRARQEEAKRRSRSPPRSRLGWQLNQAAPAVRPSVRAAAPSHQLIQPIFSMDLQAAGRLRAAAGDASLPPLLTLKQIDTHRWNSFNGNELALSSRRNNAVFLFDVSRCSEMGEPHRRIATREANSSAPNHSSAVMDFRFFPATSATHGGSQSLVVALRSGEVNVIDLRVAPTASAADAGLMGAGASVPRVHKPLQRADIATRSTMSSVTNPPASILLSSCGNLLYLLTELGTVELWDTRQMRASFERMEMLEALWNSTNAAGGGTHSNSGGVASAVVPPASLGLHCRNTWSRVCSASLHPSDDHSLLFQLVSGAVGMLDLNPASSSYRACHTVVPFTPDHVSATLTGGVDDLSLRTRNVACFLPNGQVGSTASAAREKTIAVANLQHEVQFIGESEREQPRHCLSAIL